MADGTGAGGGGGPLEPLPLGGNDNLGAVDVHFLDLPGIDSTIPAQPPVAAALVHDANQPASSRFSSGDDLLDWMATLETYLPIGEDAPHSGMPIHGDSSVSTSSTAVPQEAALDCSGCQMLREITHSDGLEATKLCIHGGAGVFYHARLDVYRLNPEGLDTLTYHTYVDFRGRDYEWVKHYLTGYALQRATGNFALVNDSLSTFHGVLCTPMNCGGGHVDDAHTGGGGGAAAATEARNGGNHLVVDAAAFQPTIEGYVVHAESEASQPSHTVHMQRPFQPVARTALAMQRERTAKLQLQDIAPCFHLPIAEAAAKLGICPTALKGVCRKHNVSRWPYRKLRSIGRQIAKLRRFNNAAARNEIKRLNASRLRILAGHE